MSEVLRRLGAKGQGFMAAVAAPTDLPARESLRWVLAFILEGLREFVLQIHVLGISVGLKDEKVGPSYLNEILEPTFACVEARLRHHIERGELLPCDVRVAALILLSPLLLGALHQGELGGHQVRPLSLDQLCLDVVDRFLLAYGPGRRDGS
jgi:hypothetical protein